MNDLGNIHHLRDLYNLGAATGMQTLRFADIGGTPCTSVEAGITDMSGNTRGSYYNKGSGCARG